MNIDPLLLEILACPCDYHAPVRPDDADLAAATSLVCTRCATTFPVREDIPVMLLDEATPGPQGIGAQVDGPVGGIGPGVAQ
ncbi:MAG: Trm112 family protein [Candidatus Nanopelagicales bacterium]